LKKEFRVQAQRLRLLRKESGLNLRELSKKVGISKSALSSYERGERDLTINMVKRLADFYNEDVEWIIGENEHRRLKKISS